MGGLTVTLNPAGGWCLEGLVMVTTEDDGNWFNNTTFIEHDKDENRTFWM
jgi:hypothetical protein